MSASPLSLAAVTVDCDDVTVQATFWSALLGTPVDEGASEDYATIGEGGPGPALAFARVPDRTPGKNVVHLDLACADREAQVDRAIGLGAKRVADLAEEGFAWTTLADPEGNLFDIVSA